MGASDGRWRLTVRGRMVSNEVFGRLLAGCEQAGLSECVNAGKTRFAATSENA